MRYYVVICILAALVNRDFYRYTEYTTGHQTVLGWTQLASLPANEECQCANGNVVRISGKGFQILSLRSEGNKTTNVTTDLLGTQTLYHKVSIGLEMPGGQQTERVLEGTDAYCAQKMLDNDKISRLGNLVAIGVATQLSQELMQTDNSAHSFWNLMALSLLMVGVQSLTTAVSSGIHFLLKNSYDNWVPWAYVIKQTIEGIETVLWTLYGNSVGIWVLRLYLDLYETPLFFYFLPIWFFVFSYFAAIQNITPEVIDSFKKNLK